MPIRFYFIPQPEEAAPQRGARGLPTGSNQTSHTGCYSEDSHSDLTGGENKRRYYQRVYERMATPCQPLAGRGLPERLLSHFVEEGGRLRGTCPNAQCY